MFKWTWQNRGPASQIIISMTEGGQSAASCPTTEMEWSRMLRDDIHQASEPVDLVQTLRHKAETAEKGGAEQIWRRNKNIYASASAFIITWLPCILHRVRVMGKDTLIGSSLPRTVPSIPFLLNNLSVSCSVQFLLSHNVLGSSPTTLTQCMWNSSWTKVLFCCWGSTWRNSRGARRFLTHSKFKRARWNAMHPSQIIGATNQKGKIQF